MYACFTVSITGCPSRLIYSGVVSRPATMYPRLGWKSARDQHLSSGPVTVMLFVIQINESHSRRHACMQINSRCILMTSCVSLPYICAWDELLLLVTGCDHRSWRTSSTKTACQVLDNRPETGCPRTSRVPSVAACCCRWQNENLLKVRCWVGRSW